MADNERNPDQLKKTIKDNLYSEAASHYLKRGDEESAINVVEGGIGERDTKWGSMIYGEVRKRGIQSVPLFGQRIEVDNRAYTQAKFASTIGELTDYLGSGVKDETKQAIKREHGDKIFGDVAKKLGVYGANLKVLEGNRDIALGEAGTEEAANIIMAQFEVDKRKLDDEQGKKSLDEIVSTINDFESISRVSAERGLYVSKVNDRFKAA
jgi:hypothetical protein